MDELRERLRAVERNAVPDLWGEIVQREPGPPPEPEQERRGAAIVVGLAVATLGLGLAVLTLRPGSGGTAAARAAPILYEVRAGVTDADSALWSVNPDGTGASIFFDAGLPGDQYGVWSPDRSTIAVVADVEAARAPIVLIRPDGEEIAELADGYCVGSLASWAPDGDSLVFVGGPPRDGVCWEQDVWRVDVESGAAVRILEGPVYDADLSPDGSTLLVARFVDPQDERSELWLAAADGSALHRITDDGGVYLQVAWSPDGRRIAASWEAPDAVLAFDIYLMNADGSGRQRITDWEGWDASPVWSPDGSQIAFSSDRDADPTERRQWVRWESGPYHQSIYVMDADGSDPYRLVRGRAFAFPSSWG